MAVTFEKRKSDFLSKGDKSSIGCWDDKIKKLCEKINKSEDYFSLSSCSGRVVLLKNVPEKKHGLFAFRTHDKIKLGELNKKLKGYNDKEGLMYKQEPFILHVACRDMVSAKRLLMLAQEIGCKHSGIMAISENRIVVEIIGSESLGLPILEKGKILVDYKMLEILVLESNARLERTWKKINKLKKIV